MLVRLAILQADKPKTAKDHLQAALKMSPVCDTFFGLLENYELSKNWGLKSLHDTEF